MDVYSDFCYFVLCGDFRREIVNVTMNTVIFSIYDDFCSSSVVLVTDNCVREIHGYKGGVSLAMIYDEDDFMQFDSLEGLFKRKVDRIITMQNEEVEKVRIKITDINGEKVFDWNGDLVDSREYK